MRDFLPNNPKTYTTRELVAALIDAMVARPDIADQPIGFTTCADQSTIYYVRGLEEDKDSGYILFTRG